MSEKSAKAARRDRLLIEQLEKMNANFKDLTEINKAIRDKQEKQEKHADAMSKNIPVVGKLISVGFRSLNSPLAQ